MKQQQQPEIRQVASPGGIGAGPAADNRRPSLSPRDKNSPRRRKSQQFGPRGAPLKDALQLFTSNLTLPYEGRNESERTNEHNNALPSPASTKRKSFSQHKGSRGRSSFRTVNSVPDQQAPTSPSGTGETKDLRRHTVHGAKDANRLGLSLQSLASLLPESPLSRSKKEPRSSKPKSRRDSKVHEPSSPRMPSKESSRHRQANVVSDESRNANAMTCGDGTAQLTTTVERPPPVATQSSSKEKMRGVSRTDPVTRRLSLPFDFAHLDMMKGTTTPPGGVINACADRLAKRRLSLTSGDAKAHQRRNSLEHPPPMPTRSSSRENMQGLCYATPKEGPEQVSRRLSLPFDLSYFVMDEGATNSRGGGENACADRHAKRRLSMELAPPKPTRTVSNDKMKGCDSQRSSKAPSQEVATPRADSNQPSRHGLLDEAGRHPERRRLSLQFTPSVEQLRDYLGLENKDNADPKEQQASIERRTKRRKSMEVAPPMPIRTSSTDSLIARCIDIPGASPSMRTKSSLEPRGISMPETEPSMRRRSSLELAGVNVRLQDAIHEPELELPLDVAVAGRRARRYSLDVVPPKPVRTSSFNSSEDQTSQERMVSGQMEEATPESDVSSHRNKKPHEIRRSQERRRHSVHGVLSDRKRRGPLELVDVSVQYGDGEYGPGNDFSEAEFGYTIGVVPVKFDRESSKGRAPGLNSVRDSMSSDEPVTTSSWRTRQRSLPLELEPIMPSNQDTIHESRASKLWSSKIDSVQKSKKGQGGDWDSCSYEDYNFDDEELVSNVSNVTSLNNTPDTSEGDFSFGETRDQPLQTSIQPLRPGRELTVVLKFRVS